MRRVAAIIVGVFCLARSPTALAGTTGTLTGTVATPIGAPIAGARVVASGSAQVATVTSDAKGTFAFLSLAPDAYVISLEKAGYERVVLRNVTVTADQTHALNVVMQPLKVIGRVSALPLSGIVSPGTTSDVYSVNRAVADAAQALGGGANLQNAYSAIATVPGLFIPPGQAGALQAVYIRGGNQDEVGYEYDGVPVNRAFDNLPAHTLPNLGQQELQVYTGGGTAGSSSSGIAGLINQVIRTGTSPGFASARIGVGAPQYYHGLTAEVGGATPDRTFSYFAGIAGYNQDYRPFDQFNGAGLLGELPSITPTLYTSNVGNQNFNFSAVYPTCTGTPPVNDPFGGAPPAPGVLLDPGCYSPFAPGYGLLSSVVERDAVLNLHLALPHHRDGGRDDLQLLYSTSAQLEQAYSGPNDAGPGLIQALLGAQQRGPIP
jgi:hypothetical protein